MAAAPGLSAPTHRHLGPLASGLERGRPGRMFRAAKWLTMAGFGLRAGLRRRDTGPRHVASGLFMLAALLFRYAWVGAGKANARDDRVVASMHRSERHGT